MKSTNFEFLRPRWPELAGLAGFAECYAHDDPVGALVKLRTFGEQIALFIFDHLHLPRAAKANFLDLLETEGFKTSVPRVVICKLHSLRLQGNRAAHGEKASSVTSLWLLKEAYDLARWLFMTFGGGALGDCPPYVEPPPGGIEAQSAREAQREKKAVLEKLAAQEALMQKLLADLEAARAPAQVAEATAAELQVAREAGQHSVDVLSFDEAATRKHLIDSMLAKAAWNIGANGKSTDEVGQEVEIAHQPTETGKGYADYVLWDDNDKPLGVIEAKKTSVDVEAGRTQAKCYADGLEQVHGRRPVIGRDIAALPEKSIAVRDHWKEIKSVGRPGVLEAFEPAVKALLSQEIAPLMQWVNIAGHEEAYEFDRLVCALQVERLKGSAKFDDLKADLLDQVGRLQINLTQVAPKVQVIERVKSSGFWSGADVKTLEDLRGELRGVMRYRRGSITPRLPPRVIDVAENPDLVERKRHPVKLEGLELVAYRNRVLKVLTDLFESNDTLKKIKAGEPVSAADLESLVSLVLTQDPQLDLHDLEDYFPETAGRLDRAIRGIIGMDAQTVHDRFTDFVHNHQLASHQVKFLDLLQNHISKYGSIAIERLYEPPFTLLHSDGLDGVFPDEALTKELLEVIGSFNPA